jgi:hypothetical protein
LEFTSLGQEGEKHKVKLNPLESVSSLCVKVKIGVWQYIIKGYVRYRTVENFDAGMCVE